MGGVVWSAANIRLMNMGHGPQIRDTTGNSRATLSATTITMAERILHRGTICIRSTNVCFDLSSELLR